MEKKILKIAKETLPELTAGDFVLLLDAVEDGCLSAAYSVKNARLEQLPFEVSDDGGRGEVQIKNDAQALVGDFSFLGNRLHDIDFGNAHIVLVNGGMRNVVIEDSVLKSGQGTAIVPIDPAEVIRSFLDGKN